MKKITRRIALKQSLAATAAFSLPSIAPSLALGLKGKQSAPNSRINIGLVGNGKIMHGHRQYHLGADDVLLASPSAVAGFVNQVRLDRTPGIFTIGPSTTEAARAAGLDVTGEASRPGLRGLLEAMRCAT